MRTIFVFGWFLTTVGTSTVTQQKSPGDSAIPSLMWHVDIKSADFIAQWEVVSQIIIKTARLNQLPIFNLQPSLLINYICSESSLLCCLLALLPQPAVPEMPSVLQGWQLWNSQVLHWLLLWHWIVCVILCVDISVCVPLRPDSSFTKRCYKEIL